MDSLWRVQFYLRPHHLASDFELLVPAVSRALNKLAGEHTQVCRLFEAVPGVVVDGKWCMRVSLFNHREGGALWEPALATGALCGCTERPLRGSKYCRAHQLVAPADAQTESLPVIENHREVNTGTGIRMQY